jgi:uncharacterized protein YciI
MYALFYDYVENIVERRAPYHERHLEWLREWMADGRIALGGALGRPPHGALIVFDVEDPVQVEDFVSGDPYVIEGLVPTYRVEPWAVVR